MIKLIQSTILGLCSLVAATSFSTTTHMLIPGMTIEYELLPEEPQTMVNFFFWAVTANCSIVSEYPQNTVHFSMLRRSGSIQDVTLNMGESLDLTFHPTETAIVKAESGAKVEVLNTSDHKFTISCSSVE